MHYHVKVIKKTSGQKLLEKAAYNNRTNLSNHKTGEKHYHRSRGGIIHSFTLLPKDSPPWLVEAARTENLNRFFSMVEDKERRRDAQYMREVTVALPHEMSDKQNIELVSQYVQQVFVDEGMVANVAIHKPTNKNDSRNIHAHILLTMREILPSGFGKKVRAWNSLVPEWRDKWEQLANAHLLQNNYSPRIKMKSYKKRGVEKEAIRYQGPTVTPNKVRSNSTKSIDILAILKDGSLPPGKGDNRDSRERDR